MRILIIGNVYSLHVRRWAEHFASDHEVHVAYLPKNSEDEVKDLFGKGMNINLVPLGNPSVTTLKKVPRKLSMSAFGGKHYITLGLKELKTAINEIKPDLIHAHYLPDYGWLASQTDFHPLVLHAWGFTILFKGRDKDNKLSSQMFSKADLVFAGDDTAKDRLVEYGCPPEKIFLQAWGVETTRFTPNASSSELKTSLFGNGDLRVVTLVRHLVDICNIDTLVRAIPDIVNEFDDVRFMIIGDGPEKKDLEKLAKDLKIDNKIVFTGNIANADLHKYLASSDLYVDTPHPTKGGGGIGVALMEAMSSGLPCVVAKRPGAEAGVRPGFNGQFFKGGDPKDLAQKTIALLNDMDKMKTYGDNSRKLALEIGDFTKNMDIVVTLYEKLIGDQ